MLYWHKSILVYSVALIPQIHCVTQSDINEIEALGYTLIGNPQTTFEAFINEFFPNFNLLKLIECLETNFSHTTTLKISREIIFDQSSQKFSIKYQNNYTSEDDALIFYREFSKIKKTIRVEHKYCVIPAVFRGSGLIKPIFQESLQQYVNFGAKQIIVHASLSGGGYTWARYGFNAIDKTEVTEILEQSRISLKANEFKVVEKIYSIYYSKYPKGKEFPMSLWAELDYMKAVLLGSSWQGTVNLSKPKLFHTFERYVFK